jgi:hypothetical protein
LKSELGKQRRHIADRVAVEFFDFLRKLIPRHQKGSGFGLNVFGSRGISPAFAATFVTSALVLHFCHAFNFFAPE